MLPRFRLAALIKIRVGPIQRVRERMFILHYGWKRRAMSISVDPGEHVRGEHREHDGFHLRRFTLRITSRNEDGVRWTGIQLKRELIPRCQGRVVKRELVRR